MNERVGIHRLPHVLAGGDVIGDFTFADQATLVSHSVDKLPPGAMQLDEQPVSVPRYVMTGFFFFSPGVMQRDEERTRRLRVDHLVYGVPGSLEEACAQSRGNLGQSRAISGATSGSV